MISIKPEELIVMLIITLIEVHWLVQYTIILKTYSIYEQYCFMKKVLLALSSIPGPNKIHFWGCAHVQFPAFHEQVASLYLEPGGTI